MSKKRKSEAARVDELDRSMYTAFSTAANSLSQLYTQAMNHQRISFQAGERQALEKLYQWIIRQHEEGTRLTIADILAYLQNEMDYYGGDDTSIPPTLHVPHQHSESTMQLTSQGLHAPSALLGQAPVGLAPRICHSDHIKSGVFSNALSSPIRRGLQPYHPANGVGHYPNGILPAAGGARNHEGNSPTHNRALHSPSSNDSSMDMNSDSPHHESY